MCAIDGVTWPGHASKATSGTRQACAREAAKMEAAVAKILQRHRDNDVQVFEPEPAMREPRPRERRGQEARKIRPWLNEPPEERRGPKGRVRQSHRTDHASATRATGTGVIQGDTGVAAVDARHQSSVAAQAHGGGQEQERLVPRIEARPPPRAPERVMTAAAGDHSAANRAERARRRIDADIPAVGDRQRDPRVAAQPRHRDTPAPRYDKTPNPDKPRLFRAQACQPAADLSHGLCPAGTRRYRQGRHHDRNGCEALKGTGTTRDGVGGPLRRPCVRHSHSSAVRQVAIFLGRAPGRPETHTARMKRKSDRERGREMVGRRCATGEPVFGKLRHNTRLNRCTRRGSVKVDGQWKLGFLVHNIEKLAPHGYAP